MNNGINYIFKLKHLFSSKVMFILSHTLVVIECDRSRCYLKYCIYLHCSMMRLRCRFAYSDTSKTQIRMKLIPSFTFSWWQCISKNESNIVYTSYCKFTLSFVLCQPSNCLEYLYWSKQINWYWITYKIVTNVEIYPTLLSRQ